MGKFFCIKTLKTGNNIDFESGKIYNGRLTNTSAINIFKNDDFTYGFSFSIGEMRGYDWIFSDYFISLAEYRDKQIEEIIYD